MEYGPTLVVPLILLVVSLVVALGLLGVVVVAIRALVIEIVERARTKKPETRPPGS